MTKTSWTILAAMLIAGTPALADVKTGVDAWNRGDYRKAIDEWRSLAIAGDADAQFNMGQAYKLGRGVPVDVEMAEAWYRKAALQGHAQAEDNLGLALFQNNRREQALPWLEKSAARGEPRAQYVLGTMLFNGDAVKKDWVRAYALMTRAAAASLPQATASLSQMDKYVSASDRQKGSMLARRYETDAQRAPLAEEAAPTRVASREKRPPAVKPTPIPPKPRDEPARTAAAAPPPPARDGGWRVQLGAFGDPGNARKLWGQVGDRFAGKQPTYTKAGTLTKLLVGPFASQSDAARACAATSPCIPTRN